MKQIKYFYITLILLMLGVNFSCTKALDLDEETLLELEKQEILEELDKLYDLSFTDIAKAEEDYNTYLKDVLLSEDENFLADNSILLRRNFTDLAIRLNQNITEAQSTISGTDLYQIYSQKFQADLVNLTLLGEIPQLLKTGEKLDAFEDKIAASNQFFDDKIEELKSSSTVDEAIVDKNWNFADMVFQMVETDFYIHTISFDFTLKSDKSMEVNSFFYMPYIPNNGSYSTAVEKEYDGDLVLNPLTYDIYDNKLFFHFHLKNNRDLIYQTGFRERHWYFEYEYEVVEDQLVLSKPKMGFYMYPELKLLTHDDSGFQEIYPQTMQAFKLSIK